MRKKREKFFPGPFVGLVKTTMATPAWRTMSFGAQSLYVELRGRLRNDARDNGKRWLSCRDAAKALGTKSTRSVVRWFAENEHYGFMRKTGEGFLGTDGFGIAARYRLTEYAYGTNPPTRDFERWNGEPFVYTPGRSRRGKRTTKKQNPVSPRDTPRVPQGHIGNGGANSSLCAPQGHTRSRPDRAPKGHTSRLATAEAQPTFLRRGSSRRAPAQAGDAGSNPAPEAIATKEEKNR